MTAVEVGGATAASVDGAAERARLAFRWRGPLPCLVAVGLAAIAAHPVTANYFFADDFLNLYHIVNDSLLQYLVTPNGGHVLLARNAVFYASWRLFGTDPAPYFWTVFVTHLVNVTLAVRVLRALGARPGLAALGAALWGTSPLNTSTLGWYSVYGQVLVVTATLLVLDGALRAAAAGRTPSRAGCAWWGTLALFAANCFGTGTAIAIVLPGVLGLLLPRRARAGGLHLPLLWLPPVVVASYVVQAWAYETLSGIDLQYTRVLPFVLSDVRAIARFGVDLLGFGLSGLLAGPFVPSIPIVWYAALGAFVVVVGTAVRLAVAERRRLLACIAVVATAYGIIALGRGAIANLFLKDTVAAVPHVSRYHYAGQLFLTLLATGTCAALARTRARWLAVVLGAFFVSAVAANVGWRPPTDHHAEAREGTAQTLAAIRAAIAAAPPGETVRIENRAFAPLPFPPALFPGWAAVFVVFFPDDVVDGRRVEFVERNPAVRDALRHGRRTGALVVAP